MPSDECGYRSHTMAATVVRLNSDAVIASSATRKNASIQSLRGLAALSVALFHASVYSGRHFGDSPWVSAFDGRFGLVGVAVFFAISGLLMADLVQRTDPWRFLAHRIARIYPAYLLAVAVALPIIGLSGIRNIGLHAFSLLLVPVGEREYYLGVEWTLVFECTYYVALFLIAVAGWRSYLNAIVLVWLGLIGFVPLFIGWDDNILLYPVYSIWLSAANVAFAGGLLIPWIIGKIRIPIGTGILALCVVMLVMPTNITTARWAIGVAATLLVLDAIRIRLPTRVILGLPTLGDWSYALYLAHVPCILVTYHFWSVSAGIGAAWLSAIGVALVVSAGFGTFDTEMYKRLKLAVDGATENRLRRWVGAFAGVFVLASLIGMVVT